MSSPIKRGDIPEIIFSSITSITRCDQTSNCFDKSDEENCKLLLIEVVLLSLSFSFFPKGQLSLSLSFFPKGQLSLSFSFFSKGQLQEEDSTLQLWQGEQCKYSGQNQCVNVGHWYTEDWRSWPHLHAQVPVDAGMVKLPLLALPDTLTVDF